MTQTERLKALHKVKPHYSCARLAEELGIKPTVASILASREKMVFLKRRDLEDIIDGQEIKL
jgi:hypothetical protein